MPRGPAAKTSRSRSSPVMRTYTPLFSVPSRFSFGTLQSSKMSSEVFEPRIPSLSSFGPALKPLKSFSMMKVEMPYFGFFGVGSVFAYT